MKLKGKVVLCGLFIFCSCNQQTKQKGNGHYQIRIYQTGIDQYGYDVNKDSAAFIHQPIIPTIQRNRGFATEQDARKVAELMIYKIENGITPPSVTTQELDSLKIKTD